MSLNALLNTHTTDSDSLPQGELTQTLAQYFQIYGIKAPPVELTTAFSLHGSESDVLWIESFYQETDVYISEMMNWTPEGVLRWQKVAGGDPEAPHIVEHYIRNIQADPRHVMKGYSIAHMQQVARYPGKYLCVIDLPAGTTLSETMRQIVHSGLMRNNTVYREFMKLQRQRDTQMLMNLPQALGNLILEHPEISKKETLKVLLKFGSNHARLYDPLKKRGEQVRRFFKEDE